jgi:hypothetical protein
MHRLDLKLETYPAVLREVNRKMKKKRQELNSSQTQVCLKPESKENWDLSISRTTAKQPDPGCFLYLF